MTGCGDGHLRRARFIGGIQREDRVHDVLDHDHGLALYFDSPQVEGDGHERALAHEEKPWILLEKSEETTNRWNP